jgi:hypothetical protein
MDPKKKDLLSLAIVGIIVTTCCLWFQISSDCSSFEYTPPKAVKRYMELVLNPRLVKDKELLRNSISDDAQKTLGNFPDLSGLPMKISEYDDSTQVYDINVHLADGRYFPVKLEFEEWPGNCPTIRKVSDETILTYIHLVEIGHHQLPTDTVIRFMKLLYSAIEQGEGELLKKMASDEAIMVLESSFPSYENVEEVYPYNRGIGEYVAVINQQRNYVSVWIEYEPFPKGFDYRKMTDAQILESLYLARAENK